MAKIPVKTLTEHCWEKCQGFKPEVDRICEFDTVYYQEVYCGNYHICLRGVECLKKEEKECHNKSQEEK